MTYMPDTNICISSITLAELGYDWPGPLLYLDAWLWRHLPGRAVCESIIQKRNPEFELPPIVRQYAILQLTIGVFFYVKGSAKQAIHTGIESQGN